VSHDDPERPLVELAAAQTKVLDACAPLAPVVVPVTAALGLVAAADVRSRAALPAFANSAMDGYAVRAADCTDPGVTLEVVGAVMAGERATAVLGAGQAVRIMTGAPVPDGADAVCPVEQTTLTIDGAKVVVGTALRAGRHVRRPGEDVAVGDMVLHAGDRVGPAHVGLLHGLGEDEVAVVPRPRVGVLSTGDELVGERDGAGSGRIRDTNRATLLGLLTGDGFPAVDLGRVGDDEDAYLAALRAAASAGCDVVCSTGGVSFGDRDAVRAALTSRVATRVLAATEVAIKPGKPQVFAVLTDPELRVFGLPGNPVAAVVSWELFVRPALRTMAGLAAVHRPRVAASAGVPMPRRRDGKIHLVPVSIHPGAPPVCEPSGRFGSHILSSLLAADGFAVLPDGDGAEEGATVECMVTRPDAVLGA